MKEYIKRTYRNRILSKDLKNSHITVRETDLFIKSDQDMEAAAIDCVHRLRRHLETYIQSHPDFLTALQPLPDDPFVPEIVRQMLQAASVADVGPMAAVAGAVAHFVGMELMDRCKTLIIENGGDCFLKSDRERTVAIFAGESPLSYKVNLRIPPEKTPLGICTSSGTVGPSLSFGRADAVCVLAKTATLADAAASSIGNLVGGRRDITRGLARSQKIEGVLGVVIIVGDQMGAWGDVEFV
jgi:ApbE superfamily uncharacterized protein (UPF0280 family)